MINSSPKLLFAILQYWTASVLRTQQNNFNSSIIGLKGHINELRFSIPAVNIITHTT